MVAVDRNPDALGLAEADVGEVVDFMDVAAVTEAGRRHSVDGVLTVSADRAVPVVAAVAEALGLPGIGSETAHLMTHKVAMRRRLAEAGVPQPRFAAARSLHEGYAAIETVGLPAVLKPADSGGQRGVFRLDSIDDLEAHLHTALSESPTEEAIIESYHEGIELNGLAIARGGQVTPLTLSDRLRPPGVGFGVGWIHVYPSRLFADPLAEAEQAAVSAVHALGLEDGDFVRVRNPLGRALQARVRATTDLLRGVVRARHGWGQTSPFLTRARGRGYNFLVAHRPGPRRPSPG